MMINYTTMASGPGDGEAGASDLDAFRAEWRKDIRHQRHTFQLHDIPWTSASGAATPAAPAADVDEPEDESDDDGKWTWTAVQEGVSDLPLQPEVSELLGPESALKSYVQAIMSERSGDLDTALRMYRTSFRIDSSVDKTFRRAAVITNDPAAMYPLRPPLSGMPDPHKPMRRLAHLVRQASLPAAISRPPPPPSADAKLSAPVLPHDDTETDLVNETAALDLGPNPAAPVPSVDALSEPSGTRPPLDTIVRRPQPYTTPSHHHLQPSALTPKQRESIAAGDLAGVIADARALRVQLTREAEAEAERGETHQPHDASSIGRLYEPVTATEKLERLGHMTSIFRADPDVPCPLSTLPEEVLLSILHRVLSLPQGAGAKRPFTDVPETDLGEPSESHDGPPAHPTHPGKRKHGPALHATPTEAEQPGYDHTALETLARTCWKLRLLSLEPLLWRHAIRHVYTGPQVAQMGLPQPDQGFLLPVSLEQLQAPAGVTAKEQRDLEREREKAVARAKEWGSMQALIRKTFGHSYRLGFVLQPRVRTGGLYIASCQYLRDGQSESSAWIRVLQRIEYFRYLRFYPSGLAVSLQTTDAPQDTVRRVHHPWILRQRGSSVGKWVLYPSLRAYDQMHAMGDGTEGDDALSSERDAARAVEYAKYPGPVVALADLLDPSMPHMRFFLVLALRQANHRTKGKWNRLDVIQSQSLNLRYGSVDDIPARHRTAFLYSPVRSFMT